MNALKEIDKGTEAMHKNRAEEARKHFLKAAQNAPQNPDVQYLLGQLESSQNNTDAARARYEQAIALSPAHEHALVALGELQLRNNNTADASTTLEKAVHVPTLEQAVQELAIGAVNVGTHEILIGSRSIREGDLLVLESEGRQFVVWLQTVGVRGVLFCDTDLQKHILKPVGSGPKELPEDSVQGVSDIRNFLDKDAQH